MTNLDKAEYIKKLYNESVPISNTFGMKYLSETRGIPFRNEAYKYIRFHEAKNMITSNVINENKEMISINRINLNNECRKVDNKVLGSYSGGFTPIGNFENVSHIAIAEGLETSLAIHAGTELPVLCAISANNLYKLPIKKIFCPSKTIIHIFLDDDESLTGEKQGLMAKDTFVQKGFRCRVHRPKSHRQNHQKSVDFLDDLNNFGAEAMKKALNDYEEFPDCIKPLRSKSIDIPKMNSDMVPEYMWNWASNRARNLNIPPEIMAGSLYINSSWSYKEGLGSTKSNKDRIVPISYSIQKTLDELKLIGPFTHSVKSLKGEELLFDDFVLPRITSWSNGGQAVVTKRFSKKIGITPITFHQLRATFLTNLLSQGVSIPHVMAISGHSKISTLNEYIRLAGIEITGVMDKLSYGV